MKTQLHVKEIANEKGLSITKLHQKSEVPYGTIRKIFRDPSAEVCLTTLKRLAQALEVETEKLIESVPDEQE
jgi:DNA-binding Xre family transcriptional regulator